ncbi:hypothetical protein BDF14DRAFT_1746438 [Spinellus fusiger]|nr:hypothetical protein BDF14DRAFT_1746438 [Spinellus fusiger]
MSFTTINFKKNEIPTCTVCKKTFKTKGNMKEHTATHNIPLSAITTVFDVEVESDDEPEIIVEDKDVLGEEPLWAAGEEEFNSNNNAFEETAFVEGIFPFSSRLEMILHCFFSKNESCFSKALAGKVVSLCKDVRDATLANPQENMPALDRILNLEKRTKSNVPRLPTITHQVAVVETCKDLPPTTTTYKFSMNKPSKHLKLLATNPLKTAMLSALPNKTPNQSVLPQQGKKWRTHLLFQHPMVTVNTNGSSVDLWVGDIVCASPGERITTTATYKLASFFTSCDRLMAEAYKEAHGFFVNNIVLLDIVRDAQLPTHTHTNSTTYHPLKRVTTNPNKQFMPVKIVPLNLFSDNTSGNTTKKWNKFEKQNKVKNLLFLCTSNKLSAMEMLPELVKDLKALERGMEMFDVEFGESVFVVGVLHLIMADNPMHVAIVCSLGARANLPCRKCHWRNGCGSGAVEQEGDAPARTKEELVEMCQRCDSNPDNNSLRSNPSTGYKLTGGEALLSLESWDLTMDCPVEILHTILLGVVNHKMLGMVPF